MNKEKSKSGDKKIPLYSKVGWTVACSAIAILTTMILRNCADSVNYGRKTEEKTIEYYYQQGEKDGIAGQDRGLSGPVPDNPLLRKAYIKGYRKGLDTTRTRKAQET